jgi:hypothetical protein
VRITLQMPALGIHTRQAAFIVAHHSATAKGSAF